MRTKGKKAGPKSLWTTEMLNDLVDIIANDDNLKRKLVFTNTPTTSNAEAYKKVVKEMEKRCDARGETFELDVTQTRNKFKKLMSTCKSALVTIKTASGIKRFQDDKQFGSWFNKLAELMKSRASCQPDQAIEPIITLNDTSDSSSNAELEEVEENNETAALRREENESDVHSVSDQTPSSSRSGQKRPLYVPIKGNKTPKWKGNTDQVNEVLIQIKVALEEEKNSTKEILKFFERENEKARQHELELFRMMFQPISFDSYPCTNVTPSTLNRHQMSQEMCPGNHSAQNHQQGRQPARFFTNPSYTASMMGNAESTLQCHPPFQGSVSSVATTNQTSNSQNHGQQSQSHLHDQWPVPSVTVTSHQSNAQNQGLQSRTFQRSAQSVTSTGNLGQGWSSGNTFSSNDHGKTFIQL